MKRTALLIMLLIMLSSSLVSAHEHNFDETKQLIDSGISCDQLTDEQLEDIGEYYMEQMHPGESHELMDQMMGGEGSESLKQMHIQMAKTLYCGESSGMMSGNMMGSGGMMGMMPMMMNMMGGENMMNFGMMGTGTTGFSAGLFGLVYFTLLAFLFSVIFWLTYKWLVNNMKIKKK